MLASLFSGCVVGIDAVPIEVEAFVGHGFADGSTVVVGLPDAAVRESRDRVKAAILNSAFRFPEGKITINLAPADIRKEGPSFDLPMALGLLVASEQVKSERLKDFFVLGELALNGALRPVRGVLPMAVMARNEKKAGMIVPVENAGEAAVVEGLRVYPAANLRMVAEFLGGARKIDPYEKTASSEDSSTAWAGEMDFSEVKGQESVKRAVEVAVAGNHNLLMVGPPGSGKSMIAKRIPTIMPELSLDEALETTKIHSVSGLLSTGQSLVRERPFRSPHHTISDAGLVGGTANPSPGEVSLAHNGVLFLDELPEFKRSVLEVLRQPLEDGKVTISRAAGTFTFPARFMLVGAMNPTPTGKMSDVKQGRVSAADVQKYLNRVSGPLLDRIDIHLEVVALKHRELVEGRPSESSAEIRKRVIRAREIQWERFKAKRKSRLWCNAQMGPRELKQFVLLNEECRNLLRYAMEELNLSARTYDRILKVSRTIADLDEKEAVDANHLSEAIGYRSLDRQLWG